MSRSRVLAALLAALLALPTSAQTVLLYSRLDAEQLRRVRNLARVYDRVFFDGDLLPGEAWREEIASRICSARTVLLLWSAHAAASSEVGKEVALAVGCGVRVIPVLLDAAPLPAEIAHLQAADMR